MTFLDGLRLNGERRVEQGLERLFKYDYYIITYSPSVSLCSRRGVCLNVLIVLILGLVNESA